MMKATKAALEQQEEEEGRKGRRPRGRRSQCSRSRSNACAYHEFKIALTSAALRLFSI